MSEDFDTMTSVGESAIDDNKNEVVGESPTPQQDSVEPEYTAGNIIEDEHEGVPSKKKDNSSVRRRIEKERMKYEAREAANAAEIQELRQRQLELMEYIKGLSGGGQSSEAPENQYAQAKKLIKESILEMESERISSEEEKQYQKYYQEQEAIQRNEDYLTNHYREELEDAVERFPDFEEIVSNSNISLSQPLVYAMKRSEDAGTVLYNLYKHHQADLKRINGITDAITQIKEIGKLEARILSKTTPKRISSAPAPINSDRATSSSMDDMMSMESIEKRIKDVKTSDWR